MIGQLCGGEKVSNVSLSPSFFIIDTIISVTVYMNNWVFVFQQSQKICALIPVFTSTPVSMTAGFSLHHSVTVWNQSKQFWFLTWSDNTAYKHKPTFRHSSVCQKHHSKCWRGSVSAGCVTSNSLQTRSPEPEQLYKMMICQCCVFSLFLEPNVTRWDLGRIVAKRRGGSGSLVETIEDEGEFSQPIKEHNILQLIWKQLVCFKHDKCKKSSWYSAAGLNHW